MNLAALRWRLRSVMHAALLAVKEDHPLRRLYRQLSRAPGVTSVWRLIAGGPSPQWATIERYVRDGGVFADDRPGARRAPRWGEESFFRDLLRRIDETRVDYAPVEKRVLIVNNGLSAGGAERQIVYTLKGLKKAGWDAHFIGEYLGRAPGLDFHLETVRQAGVAAAALKREARPGPSLYAGVPRAVAEALAEAPTDILLDILDMSAAIKALRPAVIHLWQDDTSTKHAFAALIAGARRVVLSGRNVNPSHFVFHRPHMRAAYLALAERPEILLTNNSHAGAQSYADWLGIDAKRITVVYNGVDAAAWPEPPPGARTQFRMGHGVEPGAPLVAGVFRLAPEKRPLLWIEAAAEALRRRADLRFAIAGDGPLAEAAKARAAALGVAEKILFLGELPRVSPLLAAADVFFLASEQEGLPNVLLEAQWAGLPCLTADAGGAAEALIEAETGAVARDAAAPALGAAIIRLVEDETLRQRAKTAGPKLVRERFGLARMIAETVACYQTGERRET